MNDSNGSVEPPSAAVRHDFRQSSNWLGDVSATDAIRFLAELNAIQVKVEQRKPRKVANFLQNYNMNR
jgi:hypothetical protein